MAEVPSYLAFAVVGFIFNPLFGLIAIICSVYSQRRLKAGHERSARALSDVSFSLAVTGIIGSVLVVVLVYAFGYFPAWTYYDRNDLLHTKVKVED